MCPRTENQLAIPGLAVDPGISRVVAVEAAGNNAIVLYVRDDRGTTATRRVDFSPWLLTTDQSSRFARLTSDELTLTGSGELRVFKRFSSSALWSDALRELRSSGAAHLAFPSRSEQYLVESGLSLFQGMTFNDLRRAQVDIETLGLDPDDPQNEIVIITGTINGEDQFVVHRGDHSEADIIEQLNAWIQKADPDVIEGHNIFNFDIPFLARRAARNGLELRWGRDSTPVRFGRRQRFKAGARSIPFEAAYIRGRHIIDTYQQIQRYDVAGHLTSYALKSAVAELGFERDDRTHVPGEQIADVWATDPDRLIRYAVDDVRDTNILSELALPTEFYQAQLLPSSLQSVASGGPGEKVNDLLVRAYIRAGTSIPTPRPPREYPGGFTAVRSIGIFGPVVNADVESLYPSIMLADRIAPQTDELRVFLPILETLTTERLQAKRTAATAHGAEGARWHGTQLSLKVLINSFYGYLGYSRGYFNDFEAAAKVTRRGHQVIQQIESQLQATGAEIIEIDTDGIYFVPPPESRSTANVERLVDGVGAEVGQGIRLGVDGVWEKMLSLKLKNYALLDNTGQLTIKGSSLRSRRDEPYLRQFLETAIRGFLAPEDHQTPRDLYLDVARKILDGGLGPHEIGRQESITERTFTSEANRRLARAVRGERIGERVTIYQRQDGQLERIENYASDEDRTYLLQRLRSMAERFRPLFSDDGEFEHTFPTITAGSDIDAVTAQEKATQRSLFDG
ncbi:DNA polymerase domain-containing protein [soil metagenome]